VTQFSIRTDQSGLIGLMRRLHNLGFAFLSVACAKESHIGVASTNSPLVFHGEGRRR
jgi:hypothetical protein